VVRVYDLREELELVLEEQNQEVGEYFAVKRFC
jgi:hypothetical protein